MVSSNEALQHYKRALDQLAGPYTPPSDRALLAVLQSRDQLHKALQSDSQLTLTQQQQLVSLDTQLRQQAQDPTLVKTTAKWRQSLSKDTHHWWWHLESLNPQNPLERTLHYYQNTIDELRRQTHPENQQQVLLTGLLARDQVQKALQEAMDIQSSALLTEIRTLDQTFKNTIRRQWQPLKGSHKKKLAQAFDQWRQVRRPKEEAWWWYLPQLLLVGNRSERIIDVVALLFLLAGLTGAIEIISRFVASGEGFGLLGALMVTVQTALGLFGSSFFVSKRAQNVIEPLMRNLPFSDGSLTRTKLQVSIGFFLFILLCYQILLPIFGSLHYQWGLDNQAADQFTQAEAYYKRANALQPDNVNAHYQLGILYEDIQQYDQAISQYNLAIKGKKDSTAEQRTFATNNLARLYLLQGKPSDYDKARKLLYQAQALFENEQEKFTDPTETAIKLHKNLGWVWFKQDLPHQAIAELENSIKMGVGAEKLKIISSHCLLAQAYEQAKELDKAKQQYQRCIDHKPTGADEKKLLPEEVRWLILAEQKKQALQAKP